ncbi:P-loop NTPase fold protein [Microcystis aeruginosa]|uniref:KAP NTPase domain-containing protein n=1 Tax=Microcystis aeruginosa FD4 TaxID=2686288 RepID=A0A857D1S6_MICAE|nr:P-loop NTPase fold protein [Microcystis aeruginosa]MDB9420831.1 P-loop NTPase fold protein [Microcystis aeruginosa CS-563/04]QGZ89582.1 hypothetical protein GQR42_08420 [Microcystis aeruginosa FD4]
MKRKALVIGVNQYKGGIPCPQHSLKDAKDIAQLLRTIGQFDQVQIFLNQFEDQDEGQKNPYEPDQLKILIEQLFNPQDGDTETALFYFSGNGAEGKETQKGDLLLTDFPNPLNKSSSEHTSEPPSRSISLTWLHDQLEKSPVKQQIVWLDSDFSNLFIDLFSQASSEVKYDRCFIAADYSYAGETSTHGVLTDALLPCLNPVKQIKNLITNYTLEDALINAFNWQKNLIKNIGNPILLTGRNVRTQKLWNDLAEGNDLLNLKSEADALADMLLLRDLEPPLAVGILGGWGSGKSFIMNLMQQRMNEIRSASLTKKQTWGKEEEAFPYVGHIYQIKFDAWTYAKADLWYSLTQTIFYEFNRQYTLEQEIEQSLKKVNRSQLEGGKFWKALNAMSEFDRTASLRELANFSEQTYNELEKIKSDQEFSSSLWEKIGDIRKNEKSELQNLKERLRKENQKLRWLILRKVPRYFLQKNWLSLVAFLAGLSIVVFPLLPDQLRDQLPKKLSDVLSTYTTLIQTGGFITALGTGISLLQKTQEEQEKIFTRLKQIAGEAKEKFEVGKDVWVTLQQEFLQSDRDIEQHLNKIKRYELQIEQLQQQIGLVSNYPTLNTLLEDLSRNELYEKKLGYLHQLQRKLAELTNCLYYNPKMKDNDEQFSKLEKTFPRGPARIVLFIDDLDRCPPDRVVEVLEAVQLLVKTPLFIAVVAIDERYVTRALEKYYAGVLFHQGRPSGTDYLEKIIQIPYRIRPVAHSALANYLHQQMEVEESDEETSNVAVSTENISTISVDNSQSNKTDFTENKVGGKLLDSDRDKSVTILTPEKIKFKSEEFKILLECCRHTDLPPRMIKRLVNIYKIFKIIEVLSNKVGLKSNEQTKAILSVLSLSACYPDLIREVFDDLDIQFEELESQLEGLKQEEKQQQMQKLKLLDSLLKTLESLLNTSEEKDAPHLQREYRRLHHDATILLSGITLAQFDLETFNLVRSFCFFGDVGYSPEDSQRTVRSHQG